MTSKQAYESPVCCLKYTTPLPSSLPPSNQEWSLLQQSIEKKVKVNKLDELRKNYLNLVKFIWSGSCHPTIMSQHFLRPWHYSDQASVFKIVSPTTFGVDQCDDHLSRAHAHAHILIEKNVLCHRRKCAIVMNITSRTLNCAESLCHFNEHHVTSRHVTSLEPSSQHRNIASSTSKPESSTGGKRRLENVLSHRNIATST